MLWAIAILIAYFLGSIPSAYYAVRLVKGEDLRKMGSGNLGYTNAGRALGYGWAVPVLLFDVCKGIAAVLIARWLVPAGEILPIIAGLSSIAGHSWTVFLGFKGGGKGVATTVGVFAALSLAPLLIALVFFLIVLSTSRIMSLASITLAAALAIAGGVLIGLQSQYAPSWEVFIFTVIVSSLVIVRHHSNIKRLLRGEEPKLGAKKEDKEEGNS